MAARVAALSSLLACVALGFAPHHAPLHRHVLARPTAAAAPARRGAPLMALGVFARKAKEAQIAPLKGAVEAGGAEHPIGARMAAARTGALLDAPAEDGGRSVDERGPAKFVEALRRGPKTIAVISEYRRNVVANAGGYISEVPPPNIMSSSFRGAGSAACSVLMDPVVGNCTQVGRNVRRRLGEARLAAVAALASRRARGARRAARVCARCALLAWGCVACDRHENCGGSQTGRP